VADRRSSAGFNPALMGACPSISRASDDRLIVPLWRMIHHGPFRSVGASVARHVLSVSLPRLPALGARLQFVAQHAVHEAHGEV
jgi:hypothetical protein